MAKMKPKKFGKVEALKRGIAGNPLSKVRQFKQFKPTVLQSKRREAKSMPDKDEW